MRLLKNEHIHLEHITKPIYVFLYGFSLSLILSGCGSSASYDPNIKHKLGKEVLGQDSLITLAENNLLSQLKTKTKQTIINDSCISYDWKIDEYDIYYSLWTKTIRSHVVGEINVKIVFDAKHDQMSIAVNDGNKSAQYGRIKIHGSDIYQMNGLMDSTFSKHDYLTIVNKCIHYTEKLGI